MRPEDEVRKQLDTVVGEAYDPPRDWRATLAKWAIAAALAVGMSAVIVGILDHYVTAAKKAPAPSRPVTVTIVPAK